MLSLLPAQVAQLHALAEAAFPREACALLIGREHGDGLIEIVEIVPAENVAASPDCEFELDPSTHVAVLRRLREANAVERLVGHWHSHPNGCPEPSAKDAEMVHDPGLIWVISAVEAGRVASLRAFKPRPLSDGAQRGFEEMPVEILPQN
jgi:proteasome lid subunit RPN8/RPN11